MEASAFSRLILPKFPIPPQLAVECDFVARGDTTASPCGSDRSSRNLTGVGGQREREKIPPQMSFS